MKLFVGGVMTLIVVIRVLFMTQHLFNTMHLQFYVLVQVAKHRMLMQIGFLVKVNAIGRVFHVNIIKLFQVEWTFH